ncbi:hypothetical protein GCM10018773_18170 [Streptomyces candidus]|nr:hypothetical protein GCM10018773_18170 [Streptomyces candidus]
MRTRCAPSSNGTRNVRVQDFRDLCDLTLVARSQNPQAAKLRQALDSEHHRRALGPTALFEVPDHELWSAGYAKAAKDVPGLASFRTLTEALPLVKALIAPVLAGQAEGCWNPGATAWEHRSGAEVVRGSSMGLDNKEPPDRWPGGSQWSG